MKRAGIIFLLVLTAGLSVVAQTISQSRRYDAFFLEAICELDKGNNDAAFELLLRCVEIDSTK